VKRNWKIAVIGNIKNDNDPKPEGVPPDAFADYDSIETMDAIRAALETDGHTTTFIHSNRELPYSLKKYKPDICFNMSEGLGGDAREAQVPALLEMLNIPYTASRVLANGISLDKTMTKRIWRDRKLPVAPFQEFNIGDEPLRSELKFPLFVKPAREGTGMGVDAKAIVNNEKELRERVEYIINAYQQPALVETFLPGREFTVGILGREDSKLYSRNPDWYEKDGFHRFPILELDTSGPTETWIYTNEAKSKDVGPEDSPGYFCPAEVEPELEKKLRQLALRAHQFIYALDISRTDIRLDEEGNPRLIEINTLPGLTPNYSDLCLQANAENMRYEDLILDILYLAAGRWGMIEPREVEKKK
jgi:D-alanine-D-alanine ligase